MSGAKFEHRDLKLIQPSFEAPITDLIIELDYLRKKTLTGSTQSKVFFQLKSIFQTIESIGSARIEGNNTTIIEYVEATKIEQKTAPSENIKEIKNIENAMSFIENNIQDNKINRIFLSEIHKKIVEGLEPPPKGEGDHNPGIYRTKNVIIAQSSHLPPDCSTINQYMDELFSFINQNDSSKYDLLKIAIAHHRFVWVHPFLNGNGRTVRLFTYAMLLKQAFNVKNGRILNPTAVFCNNREDYYKYLSLADNDNEENEGLLMWCEYVLKGLKTEIEKIDKLLDYPYLKKEILLPAINYSLERQYITENESKILKRVIEKQIVQASDLADIFPAKLKQEISRQIAKLIKNKMLMPVNTGKRKYIIRFDNSFLLRGIIKILGEKEFLPIKN